MNAELVAGVLLIAVPVLFNVAFFALGASFDYPGILRRPAGEILTRFDAGGARLRLQWWALMATALGMLPVAALLGSLVAATAPALGSLVVVLGTAAGLVQALGLARWPFVVPELARRWVAAEAGPAGDASRAAIEVTFVALHRLLGVGIGEHLGYLLTATWTIVVGIALATGAGVLAPAVLGIVAIVIGAALLVGSFEFVGPNEPTGWWVADRIVPIAYVAWSAWLAILGIAIAL